MTEASETVLFSAVSKANAQRQSTLGDLRLEHQAAQRELASLGTKLRTRLARYLPKSGLMLRVSAFHLY